MSFSTAKHHKSFSQDQEEDMEEGYYTYTIDDEKFDYQHQKEVEDRNKRYQSPARNTDKTKNFSFGKDTGTNKKLNYSIPTSSKKDSLGYLDSDQISKSDDFDFDKYNTKPAE